MLLPNREHATVAIQKLTNYLLDPNHPVGGKKSTFFYLIGYKQNHVLLLQSQLIEIAHTCEVAQKKTTVHGTNFVLIGLLKTPTGRMIKLRTVWTIDNGEENPRFVTAYPE